MKGQLDIEFLPINDFESVPVVEVEVFGNKCRMLLDTGCGTTVLREDFVEKYICNKIFFKSTGLTVVGFGGIAGAEVLGAVASFEFKGSFLKNKDVHILGVFPLDDEFLEKDYKFLDGILGNDILKLKRCVIDYGKSKIFFNT